MSRSTSDAVGTVVTLAAVGVFGFVLVKAAPSLVNLFSGLTNSLGGAKGNAALGGSQASIAAQLDDLASGNFGPVADPAIYAAMLRLSAGGVAAAPGSAEASTTSLIDNAPLVASH